MNMDVKAQIQKDLKTAMLAGDKNAATVLRGLKSAILYVEVAEGKRDTGLDNDAVIGVLSKEAKKRQETADMYSQAGQTERAEAELAEKSIIEQYLPEQLSDEALLEVIDAAIVETKAAGPQAMGQVIGAVKQQTAGQADGGRIAKLVKERLQ